MTKKPAKAKTPCFSGEFHHCRQLNPAPCTVTLAEYTMTTPSVISTPTMKTMPGS
jgi:hypothetical protein